MRTGSPLAQAHPFQKLQGPIPVGVRRRHENDATRPAQAHERVQAIDMPDDFKGDDDIEARALEAKRIPIHYIAHYVGGTVEVNRDDLVSQLSETTREPAFSGADLEDPLRTAENSNKRRQLSAAGYLAQ